MAFEFRRFELWLATLFGDRGEKLRHRPHLFLVLCSSLLQLLPVLFLFEFFQILFVLLLYVVVGQVSVAAQKWDEARCWVCPIWLE